MIIPKLLGAILVARALIQIAAVSADPRHLMGGLAVLVPLVTLAAGAMLLRYPRRTA